MEQLKLLKSKHYNAKPRELTLRITVSVMGGHFAKDNFPGSTIIYPGQKCILIPGDKDGNRWYFTPIISGDAGKTIKCSSVILKCFKEIQWPSKSIFEDWMMDNKHVETPLGYITEPDGHDEEGWPSWLLILGYI